MARTLLVTGMGGNVGQGIVRSIRAMGESIRIVGTNTERVCAGTHLCDTFYVVPYAVAPDYLPRLREICAREAVELIIPSTDYEAYYLGVGQPQLPPVAVSPPRTSKIFLDKLETARFCLEHGIAFAESVAPADYLDQYDTVVVKPREGRGSRGVVFDPPMPGSFSADYVVQRRYVGTEITSAFYVRRDGKLHGQVTMTRALTHGMTSACETTFAYDREVEEIIRALLGALEIRGSCNVQSIVAADGSVTPFEINGRLSGTTSIRGQLGFPDAVWTVDEYLFGRELAPPHVLRGAAVRIMMDVVYPTSTLEETEHPSSPHFIF